MIDYISDIHLDFYIDPCKGLSEKIMAQIDSFTEALLPKKSTSKILVVAGDLGHYNYQNQYLLKSFKRFYDDVVFVLGNHDLYLTTVKQQLKYKKSSFKRVVEMFDFASETDGIHMLHAYLNNFVILDGVTIVGDIGCWGSLPNGRQLSQLTEEKMFNDYETLMNDSRCIFDKVDNDWDFSHRMQSQRIRHRLIKSNNALMEAFDFNYMYNKKYASENHKTVFVSHYPVNFDNEEDRNINAWDFFYWFDPIMSLKEKLSKIPNIHGHVHHHDPRLKENQFLNPLGYPNETYRFNGFKPIVGYVYDADAIFTEMDDGLPSIQTLSL